MPIWWNYYQLEPGVGIDITWRGAGGGGGGQEGQVRGAASGRPGRHPLCAVHRGRIRRDRRPRADAVRDAGASRRAGECQHGWWGGPQRGGAAGGASPSVAQLRGGGCSPRSGASHYDAVGSRGQGPALRF